jgi:hypothetical protein
MFGTIRRHQKWLWLVISTLTVISFLWYFSPTQRLNRGNGGGLVNYGSINGERITKDEFSAAWNDARLNMFFMSGGRWPDDSRGSDLQAETYKWMLLLQKEEQLGIHINTTNVAQVAQQMIAQTLRGRMDPKVFETQVLIPARLDMSDFQRFCHNYLALQELIATVGMTGRLVTTNEITALYQRDYQQMATEAVFFSASNYLSQVTVLPDAISQFYSNQQANYRIPERVQVYYVEFPISNFIAQAESVLKTNLTNIVAENMSRLGTNYTLYGKTPEEAKAKIQEEVIHQAAAKEARRKAAEFGSLLDTDNPKPSDLTAAASTNGLVIKTTAPFDRQDGPEDLDLGPDATVFAKAAFSLSSDQPFAGPFVGQNSVYEIGYSKKIPSENPPLDKIRDRVVADYRFTQALTIAHQSGMAFSQTLSNGMAQGKSFDELCQAARLQPVTLPPLSLATQSLPEVEGRASLNQLKQAALGTLPGKASPFMWPSDMQSMQRLESPGGFILHVKSKLPLDEAAMKADLPQFTARIRQRGLQDTFNLWFSKEAQKGLVDTPVFQRPPPTMSTAAGS